MTIGAGESGIARDGADAAADAQVPARPPVSGGPIEVEPECAHQIFGAGVERARQYVRMLSGPGTERGLMGPREAPRLWSRHVLNCAAVAELIERDSRVVDIGSGAGLPGIPLLLATETVRVDLVESLLRRATFLSEVVIELDIGARCRVVRGRAEEAVGTVGNADAVTARAVAPLHKLARWAAPLLRPGGELLAIKGESAFAELERDRAALKVAGFTRAEVVTAGSGLLEEPTTVVRAVRGTGRRRSR